MGERRNSRNANLPRGEQEKGEGLTAERVDAPKERFQTEQQVTEVEKSGKMNTPASGFAKKEVDLGGSQLRQEIASEVITRGTGSGAEVSAPGRSGLRSMSYSGDAGKLLGDTSGTPILDRNIQGNARVDKRLSDANKDINYLASEQVVVKYQNVDPLAASKDEVGYNGTPKNIAARSQKKSGLTAAELLYDRSIDYIAKDEMVFTTGQVVKGDGDYADYPTETYVYGNYTSPQGVQLTGWHKTDFARSRGNYAPRELVVKVKKASAGQQAFISKFDFEVDDYSCNNEDFVTVNKASTNERIDLNKAELARQTIDQEAGSPTAEHFNPLGRSVDQPSRTVMYLRDIETTAGATVFTAYKYAQKARGHYLMRTIKDGQDVEAPALDALYGHLLNVNSRNELVTALNGRARDGQPFIIRDGLLKGSAAVMIPLFDSPTKYKTKADIINQPRGLKMHYQTADNNMDPFKVKPEFVSALNSIDVYSTIDRGYDAMGPICVTDNVRLIYPYNFHDMLNFTRSQAGERNYGSDLFTYYYSAGNGQNTYYIKAAEPVLNGIAYFFDLHAEQLWQVLKAANATTGEYEIRIPTVHSTMHFSLWDLLIMASTPYIIYERTNTMKDILDFEEFFRYPFDGLISIKEANPMNAVNYSNPSFLEPLVPGKMLPSSAIRWIWPEKFSTVGNDVMAPFYFNEDSFDYSGTAGSPKIADNGTANFSTPVLRSGIRLSGLDYFWGMEPKETLLCYDAMVRLPGAPVGTAIDGYGYKYALNAEGIPVMKESFFETLKYSDLHKVPRMLGWFMPAYNGECCVIGNSDTAGEFGQLLTGNQTDPTGETCAIRVIMYKGQFSSTETLPTAILDGAAINTNRAQAFTQYWTMRRATLHTNNVGAGFDVCLSLGEAVTNSSTPALKDNYTLFKPYVRSKLNLQGGATVYDGHKLIALHRALWAVAQKLPFIINPFDDVNGASVDPFSWAYIFGLAGFMSANYDELEYNRMNQVQNQAYGYGRDPFVAMSPVFKDAIRDTQVGF